MKGAPEGRASLHHNQTGDVSQWAGWRVPDDLLERGLSPGHPSLFVPLLRKLSSGAPVTILAIGSSVVGAHAGCTAPWPMLRHCPCPRCCGSRCGRWGGGGWALRVLAQLNATWPHPGHRLLNLGEPGGDLMPSLLACPASYLSVQPDVILLDFFTSYHAGKDAGIYERVVRMLLTPAHAAPPPVVMFVNFFEFGDRHHAKSRYTTIGSQLAATLAAERQGGAGGTTAPASADAAVGGGPPLATTPSEASRVVDLWHAASSAAVTRMATLIRAWGRRDGRHAESTDVWRNWWRDQEVRALQTAYRLPAVWMFRAFGEEFETHRHGLYARDFACYGSHA